jgi:SAM-dependent methyltransferase
VSLPDHGSLPASIDVNRPNAARIYDYALGGSHNFAVDREFADQMWAATGYTPLGYQLNRSFLRRSVRFMLDAGIDQFLDLGSGIPTVGNVHEIAQQAKPDARVVYVDSEPVAFAHARYLLNGNTNATILHADLRDVDAVLSDPDTVRLLDFSRPIGLLMVAILHFVPGSDDPAGIVRRYRAALRGGGYLALSHFTADGDQRGNVEDSKQWYQQTATPVLTRTADQIRTILDNAELVPPGLVWTPDWRAEPGDLIPEPIEDAALYAAVARL